jgi:hypothetical protein
LKRDLTYDVGNTAARGADWSLPESALANGIAAVKAHLRGHDDEAWALLRRGFQRAGLTDPAVDLFDATRLLVLHCVQREPRLAEYGAEVIALARHGMSDANTLRP